MENGFIKIANATYKVLDFFPDSDPLKNKAKEKVLSFLEYASLVFGSEGWVSLQKEKAALQLLDSIEILKTYLSLGKQQGWIDTVNFLILIKEYDSIKSKINRPKQLFRRHVEIIPEKTNNAMELKNETIQLKKEPISEDSISERQEKILEILTQKQKAQVSDIIKEIPDVTKRTLRRDLDDLLKKSKIIRSGEWSQVFYRSA